MAGSHAALDAASMVIHAKGWIPGSRSAFPRMTFGKKSCYPELAFNPHESHAALDAASMVMFIER